MPENEDSMYPDMFVGIMFVLGLMVAVVFLKILFDLYTVAASL